MKVNEYDMVFGLDSNFNEEALVQRINSDLANDLGNLFSRVLSMAHKYFGGVIPQPDSQIEKEMDLGLGMHSKTAVENYIKAMEQFAFSFIPTVVI